MQSLLELVSKIEIEIKLSTGTSLMIHEAEKASH